MVIKNEQFWDHPAPHTEAKHLILRQYLQAWFPIFDLTMRQQYEGQDRHRLIYIDGFCGKGVYEDGSPGSPIIALEAAINCNIILNCELIFYFIDSRKKCLERLKKEIEKIMSQVKHPERFVVKPLLGKFEDKMRDFLKFYEGKKYMPPTFTFIDPCGIKGVHYDIVKGLLEKPKSEVLINFNVLGTNRCLGDCMDDKTKKHAFDLLGTSEDDCVLKNQESRKKELRIEYFIKLKGAARFVRHFEMKNCRNVTLYHLFFATNHRAGHNKMKEAMWKVNPEGGLFFSDATGPAAGLFRPEALADLAGVIYREFGVKGKVTGKLVRVYVEDETHFLNKHKAKALDELKDQGKIKVEEKTSDGKKVAKSQYPDKAVIHFL